MCLDIPYSDFSFLHWEIQVIDLIEFIFNNMLVINHLLGGNLSFFSFKWILWKNLLVHLPLIPGLALEFILDLVFDYLWKRLAHEHGIWQSPFTSRSF